MAQILHFPKIKRKRNIKGAVIVIGLLIAVVFTLLLPFALIR